MKPSLHELISDLIYEFVSFRLSHALPKPHCDELAEQIIKIVRDYHLVESITECPKCGVSRFADRRYCSYCNYDYEEGNK